jgi:hypothetical protein
MTDREMRGCSVAATVGAPLVKLAVGLVGLIVVAALISPAQSEAPARSEAIDSARHTDSVILLVPEGEQAGHLSVVDEEGRELALLSRLRDGRVIVVANRGGRGGLSLACSIEGDGAASLEFIGAVRHTSIDIQPDGGMRTIERDSLRRLSLVPAPNLLATDHPRSVGRPDGTSGDEASAPSYQRGLR